MFAGSSVVSPSQKSAQSLLGPIMPAALLNSSLMQRSKLRVRWEDLDERGRNYSALAETLQNPNREVAIRISEHSKQYATMQLGRKCAESGPARLPLQVQTKICGALHSYCSLGGRRVNICFSKTATRLAYRLTPRVYQRRSHVPEMRDVRYRRRLEVRGMLLLLHTKQTILLLTDEDPEAIDLGRNDEFGKNHEASEEPLTERDRQGTLDFSFRVIL